MEKLIGFSPRESPLFDFAYHAAAFTAKSASILEWNKQRE